MAPEKPRPDLPAVLRPLRRHRSLAIGTALAAIALVVISYLFYRHSSKSAPDSVTIELAGSISVINRLISDKGGDAYLHFFNRQFLTISLNWVAIVLAGSLGYALSNTRMARRASKLAVLAGSATAALAIVANVAMRFVLPHPASSDRGWATLAQAATFTRFAFLFPAAVIGLIAVTTALWRAIPLSLLEKASPWRKKELAALKPSGATELVTFPAQQDLPDEAARLRAAWWANSQIARTREPQATGFCISGGGIRSATFALGALASLRPQLLKSRYLVSVSGGGFTAGAMQLALQPPTETETDGEPGQSVATPADVFMPGSCELDHTRRHGKYLAEGTSQWLLAIGTVLRGVAVNVITLALFTVLLGRLIAHAYASYPGDLLAQDHWQIPAGILWSIGLLFAAALAAWLVAVLVEPQCLRTRAALRSFSRGSAGAGLLVAVFGVALPFLAFICHKPASGTLTGLGLPTSLSGGAVAALAVVLTNPNSRRTVTSEATKVKTWYGKASPVRRSLAVRAAIVLGLAAMVFGMLLMLGVVLSSTGTVGGTSTWPGHWEEGWLTVAFALAFGFLVIIDQVRWSLHPFYRRRLASAFSVRRVRRGNRVSAEPYDFETETTPLACMTGPNYCDQPTGFPQLIFSCAAHVSGQDITPPGRNVVPWTMSGDYVGSPLLGWARTEQLYAATPPTVRRDLTVQAAQAISGAAIASQMGRMQQLYSKLLTLSNVRLGSWLPNPTYIDQLTAIDGPAWWRPRIPRRRYLNSLVRELVGHFPSDGPLLYVTDGGHYDNLGLIELLRHRCATVVCIDASGDISDVAATLAEDIRLAYEELGVEIELDKPANLSAEDAKPATAGGLLEQLESRFARSCTVTGRIIYPDLGTDLPRTIARFVLGKAVLTKATPFDLLAYASKDLAFPNDSTADQWFDYERFDSYHALGCHVGKRVAAALDRIDLTGTEKLGAAQQVAPPVPAPAVAPEADVGQAIGLNPNW
jgi:hypothetical protein